MLATQLCCIALLFCSAERDSGQVGEHADVRQRLPKLIRSLSSKDPRVRLRAIQELKTLGARASAAVPYLVKALGDKDSGVAAAAADALVMPQMGPGTLPLVLQALESPDENTRLRAAEVLRNGSWDPKLKVPLLIRGLANRQAFVRMIVAGELDSFRCNNDPAALQALIKLARSEKDRDVLKVTVGTLGTFEAGAAPAIPLLVEILKQEADSIEVFDGINLTLEQMAVGSLVEIGEKAIVPLLSLAADPKAKINARREAILCIWRINPARTRQGRQIVPKLIPLLKEQNDSFRSAVVWLLGSMGKKAEAAAPALTTLLRQGPQRERVFAAKALYQVTGKSKTILPALLRALQAKDSIARLRSAWVLKDMGPTAKAAIPALVKVCQDRDKSVRLAAVGALGSMRPLPEMARKALRERLRDPEESVRRAAEEVLHLDRLPQDRSKQAP